jgi:hypothetical protein
MAKAPKILNYKNLSYEKYEFGQPFKQPNGIYQAMCSYRLSKNETLPFYLETPKLKTVSGIVKLDSKYYMDLELPQTGDASSFYNYLLKTDEHNITVCHQNSKDWFNQYMPLDVVESFYKSPVILRPGGQLPVMRVRLPSYKGNILTEIYNIKKEKVNDVLCIAEDDYIIGIIELTGLAFMSQSFYPVYELQKIKIFKENEHRVLPAGYIFSDFNEKVDLDNITTPIEEERILKDKPKLEAKPVTVTASITPSVAILDTLAAPPIESISANTSLSTKNNTTLNENIEQILKVKEPMPMHIPSAIISNVSTTNVKKDEKKEPSLFDIVKTNTLKGALLDDDIFMQHSLGIKTAYQQREANLRKFLGKQNKLVNPGSYNTGNTGNTEKLFNSEIPDTPVINTNMNMPNSREIDSYQETSLEVNLLKNNNLESKHTSDNSDLGLASHLDINSSISVQDTINLETKRDVELDINSHNDYIDEDTLYTLDTLDIIDDAENKNDNSDSDNSDFDNNDDDNDSDDGIDYKILDDLEVVVFED